MEIYYNQEWARDARYTSFWAHYSAVEKWRTDHARMAEVACRVARNKKKPNQRRRTGGWFMGKKRAREAEEEEVEHLARKKVKIEIPSDVNEEAEVVIQEEKPSKKKHKKDRKKREERIKRENVEEFGEESEDATPHVKKEYRKKARGMDLSRTREILDFEEAKRLILTNKKCGLKVCWIFVSFSLLLFLFFLDFPFLGLSLIS
ncbi:hypothetical protein ANCCAN_27192 [Ancylostoma caninum]|uniref:Uncharacterized protein n=1 Tax=Ancylostoma caninum TaxID=29170 RepID=A0A368F8A4_ANCCA|nr:hypothetical protein ANCCAN_27192 [Ancylostoma caninum]